MKTKKLVTDIQAVNVELDAEDRELMAMFQAKRQIRLDDMLMVTDGDETYLVDKAKVVNLRKLGQDAFDFLLMTAACYIVLADSFSMAKRFLSPLVGLPVIGLTILGFAAAWTAVRRCRKAVGSNG